MPLQIIEDDITKVRADAIVNAANRSLLGGGGVDGAIHRAAGPGLLEECRLLGGCETGDAKITQGYNLPARYVIHSVGPIWQGGRANEAELLASCYRRSLELAQAYNLESIAFPLISTGVYGYPAEEAIRIAIREIRQFLEEHDMLVFLVFYRRRSFHLSDSLKHSLEEYIESRLNAGPAEDSGPPEEPRPDAFRRSQFPRLDQAQAMECVVTSAPLPKRTLTPGDLEGRLEDTFSESLLRWIEEKGWTDAECYKKANVDRKLFSKIRSDPDYQPSKQTAIAFAIALELNLDQTRDLLKKAGFALSNSSRFDLILQYFIEHQRYDIFEINEALFQFDQKLLGH